MVNKLAGPVAKVERARKHLLELESEVRAFLGTQPYRVATGRNPDGRLIYFLSDVRETPPILPTITGDVLQNLRSALDHVAYRLVLAGTGKPGPFYHVYFPISNSLSDYQSKRKGRTKGMRPEAIKAIDALQPYKDGNETLWRIDKLNNVDKHRLLITVGSAFRSVDIGGQMFRRMKRALPEHTQLAEIDDRAMQVFYKVADRMFPLKAGDVLFEDLPDAEVDEKLEFRFDVAFGEPTVVEGEPLLETLYEMVQEVENTLPIFEPLLK